MGLFFSWTVTRYNRLRKTPDSKLAKPIPLNKWGKADRRRAHRYGHPGQNPAESRDNPDHRQKLPAQRPGFTYGKKERRRQNKKFKLDKNKNESTMKITNNKTGWF